MEEIIKINQDTMTISGRDLHEVLEIKERFSLWAERQKAIFGEEITTVSVPTEVQNNGGIQIRELDDFIISIDNAKHICLMSKTKKGKECRQYLIDLEKVWNTPEQVMARALRLADETIAGLKLQVKQMQPKVDFYNTVTNSEDAFDMEKVAKILNYKGIGRNKLFALLREYHILKSDNVPYQKWIDKGFFRVVEKMYHTPDGSVRIYPKTLVYQSGIDAIRRFLDKLIDRGLI